ncbi:39S ribosomal protein L15, mitochondrial [Lingula anatina]|uniref:Large ribosomal subunit protein uL15m n=1 Tax=Lingula anatina TaxID=7574 RepID=A0A1S3J5B8_LINAN|nr:39S ribosomal protein L15, mitochondrial [Lingula anatina]|eukprot:XP_013405039.1 39S ribosomal protein L15, mitochondrial [Lingula anatina]
MANMWSGVEKAIRMIKKMPRVQITNVKDNTSKGRKSKMRRGQHGGDKCGRGNKGQGQRNNRPRLGFEGGNSPFYLRIPKEPYYKGHFLKKEYPPFSLLQLQRAIDLYRIDDSQPIDLAVLCNTKLYQMDVDLRHYGVHLTEEGFDLFQAQINIEVQWASEAAIAAVESRGGVITTRFYDPESLRALVNPVTFFKRGVPIPRCKLPPMELLDYYSDPKNRGYLSDPDLIKKERFELSQKYGYSLPEVPYNEMLLLRKDPRQVFYGLQPGWVVNLRDRVILKPKDPEIKQYYEDRLEAKSV